jgi:hypothetical protein
MGILNDKTRVLDTIITANGKSQMSSGKIRFEFVSYTDGSVFYDGNTGKKYNDNIIQFEASSRPHDNIIIETDSAGELLPFSAGNIDIKTGKILSGTLVGTRVTGSHTHIAANDLLLATYENFKKLRYINTIDSFTNNLNFNVTTDNKKNEFVISNLEPAFSSGITKISIENVDSFYQDEKLSHLPNFKYLPPIEKNAAGVATKLASYEKLDQEEIKTLSDVSAKLKGKRYIDFDFNDFGSINNILMQVFDVRNDSIEKLALIDTGEFNDEFGNSNRVFYLGKIYIDKFGMKTYVNVFTGILS